jgi:hypothetical protein
MGVAMATKDEQRAALDAELAQRLKMAEDPSYEGEVLNRAQHWLLATAGLIIPAVLLIIGWVAR